MVKVNAQGIQDDAAKLIRNWLSGRRQQVCIKKSYSNWSSVTSDAPQGSVLAPLLFLIYLNDLDTILSSKCLNLQMIPNFETEIETRMT